MRLLSEREAVVKYSKQMLASGLVKGTGGNISLSNPEKTLLAVTPSGVDYVLLCPEDVVILDMEGKQVEGSLQPTSEKSFHLALQNIRSEIHAVVHTHSDYATAIATLRWELPAIHYLLGFAGHKVPLAQYATHGTQELSDNICAALGESNAVLLANHGLVCVGSTLEDAFTTAEMVEYVAKIFLLTKSVGEPVILDEKQMVEVIEKFKNYGQKR